MSKCCFASTSFCSEEFFALDALDNEEKLTVYGELHLLPSNFTKTFQVCSTHRQQVEADAKKRFRRKECDVPRILGPLAIHTNKRAGDRHVTGNIYKKVAEKTGIFIPVGTPICRLCREKLLVSEAPADEENIGNSETKDDVEVMPCEQIAEPPSKRKKSSNISSMYEYYSHGKEDLSERTKTESEIQHAIESVSSQQSQSIEPSQSSEASEDSVMEVDKHYTFNYQLALL